MGAQLAATACAILIRQINPTPAEIPMVEYTMSDIHAVGAAHNLLAAVLEIDPLSRSE